MQSRTHIFIFVMLLLSVGMGNLFSCSVSGQCATESDCSGDSVCNLGFCQQECTSSAECASGQLCQTGFCQSVSQQVMTAADTGAGDTAGNSESDADADGVTENTEVQPPEESILEPPPEETPVEMSEQSEVEVAETPTEEVTESTEADEADEASGDGESGEASEGTESGETQEAEIDVLPVDGPLVGEYWGTRTVETSTISTISSGGEEELQSATITGVVGSYNFIFYEFPLLTPYMTVIDTPILGDFDFKIQFLFERNYTDSGCSVLDTHIVVGQRTLNPLNHLEFSMTLVREFLSGNCPETGDGVAVYKYSLDERPD